MTLENKSQLRPVQVQLSSKLGLRLTRSQTGSGKICVPEKFLVKKFFLGYIKLLGPKKFNVPKICVPKQIYLPKHLWVHKVLGPKKFCMPKISGSQEKICLNKLDEEKILDLKILF